MSRYNYLLWLEALLHKTDRYFYAWYQRRANKLNKAILAELEKHPEES